MSSSPRSSATSRSITSARSGRIDTIGDDRYLLLSNGQRLERPLAAGLKISEFGTYGAKVGGDRGGAAGQAGAPAADAGAAGRSDAGQSRRTRLAPGHAAGGANFVLLALTLTSVNPRVGRSGNLMLALFAFVVYST